MIRTKPIALAAITLWLAAAPLLAGPRQYDFKQTILPNGLRVITLEDFSCPVVAVQVWYHVGSKNEDPQRQGFAHMFEHMMFRGTDRLGSKDHFEFIRRTGGDCNAFTAFDNTTYVNELPSNQLELALWLEAERMVFLKIDDDSFYTERKVVEEERRLGTNRPYGKVPEQILPVLFKSHPYRWTPIGSIPHLRAATIDELAAFWSKFYVPNNATLVIVGAVKNEDAQKLAERYFGWIPKCPDAPTITEMEPPQTAAREIKIEEKKGPVPIVGFAYRTAPEASPDQVPLEMLMTILGGGESSRLYQDLVKKQKICQVAIAGAFALEDDGLAGAGAVMLPLVEDKEKVLKEIEKHIQKIVDEPVTDQELTKVRNQMLSGVVTGSMTVASKANLLGQAALIYRDPERLNKRLVEINAVTIADIQRVAKTYLVLERRTTVRVEPSVGGLLKNMLGMGAKEEDEGAAPASKPATNRIAARVGEKSKAVRPDDFPAKPPLKPLLDEIPVVAHDDKTLPNGLHVVVIPNHEVPYITMTLGLKYGAWVEDKPGVASMTLGMLTKGTKHHDAKSFAEETEFNAVNVGGSAGMDVASVSASCLTQKFELATKLLAEVVLEPTFPADEFKVMKRQLELGLSISTKEAAYVADREFRKQLYGEHPYARNVSGELPDVRKLSIDDLPKWWKTYARPDMAVLYIAGDVKSTTAFGMAAKYLGDWKAEGAAPTPKLAEIPKPSAKRIYLVNRPGSIQSQIRAGHVAIRRDNPDYQPATVMSQILGGGFNSRLNEAIRVNKGLTYGAGGGMRTQRFAGSFTTNTFSKTGNTAEAVTVLLDEINRMRETLAKPDEVEIAKSYLVGSFAGARETPQATVSDLWMIEYEGLKPTYFQDALAAYKKVTIDDVKRLADKLIDPTNLSIVVVGDADALEEQLKKIAPVTRIETEPQVTKESEGEKKKSDVD